MCYFFCTVLNGDIMSSDAPLIVYLSNSVSAFTRIYEADVLVALLVNLSPSKRVEGYRILT